MIRHVAAFNTKMSTLKDQLIHGRESRLALENMMSIASQRPLDINIETTNYCPLRCVFCPNHKKRRIKSIMDMSLFRKICSNFHEIGGGAVGICSMQSDLFSDDLLFDRLLEITKYKDLFFLYTNTNLVGTSKLSDTDLEFFLRTFDYLEISIGGLTRDEYNVMFGVDAFHLVKEELFRIAAMVKAKDIPIMLDLSIRTNNIFKLYLDRFTNNELLDTLRTTYNIHNMRNNFFSWGGLVTQSDLPKGAKIELVDNSSTRKDCIVPWVTLSVNADGSVVGCGCLDWEARHIIGDMTSQQIQDIWASEEAKAFRTSFSRNKIPSLCGDCSFYTPRDTIFSRPKFCEYKPTDGLYYKQ